MRSLAAAAETPSTAGKAHFYQDAEEIGRTIEGEFEIAAVDTVRPVKDLGKDLGAAELAVAAQGTVVPSLPRDPVLHSLQAEEGQGEGRTPRHTPLTAHHLLPILAHMFSSGRTLLTAVTFAPAGGTT